jgi:hypothetical protein
MFDNQKPVVTDKPACEDQVRQLLRSPVSVRRVGEDQVVPIIRLSHEGNAVHVDDLGF